MRVDLLLNADGSLRDWRWDLGKVLTLPSDPAALGPALDAWVAGTDATFCLFWHPRLGAPDAATIEKMLQLPGDVWHAGLTLGMGGLPRLMDCVHPIWMLNRDPNSDVLASSWRISLDACLARVDVLRQLGGVDPAFDTLEGASLDFGFRILRRGAIVRHVPWLISRNAGRPENDQPRSYGSEVRLKPDATFQKNTPGEIRLTVHDELRIVRQHHGAKWLPWCLWRGTAAGYPFGEMMRAAMRIRRDGLRPRPAPYDRGNLRDERFKPADWTDKVSVVIPTLDRYTYLRNALDQLRLQTICPKEIIVVDQTPSEVRDRSLACEFTDLPLKVFYQDALGQCTARNKAIAESTGEFLLFMDDDTDEIRRDFIESLLRTCEALGADMVASSVEEAGAGPTPEEYRLMRVVDIFPVGTMVRRTFFQKAGLFDYAFDRGARADGDVAMRGYLAGALMILNPAIRVAHWRASRGGLRVHGARVITTASSRARLTHRDVPSPTELYLVMRHFTARQLREMEWQRVFGTLTGRGNPLWRLLKMLVSVAYLPNTIWRVRENQRTARAMMAEFPRIPVLTER
jgi:hypothetical protein